MNYCKILLFSFAKENRVIFKEGLKFGCNLQKIFKTIAQKFHKHKMFITSKIFIYKKIYKID